MFGGGKIVLLAGDLILIYCSVFIMKRDFSNFL